MTQNFNIEFNGANFEFISMNRVNLQLYQVYVLDNGQKKRFHMQVNGDGIFYITDKTVCPKQYHELESTMSDAILKLGKI